MHRRNLGASGPSITAVGLGSWAIGGSESTFNWGPQDDDASIEAILRAVDRGLSWIDTAGVYGLGHAEEVVGAALRKIPAADRPLVFTKGGLVWDPANRTAPPKRVSRPDSLRKDIEASLRRLGIGTIDLFQVHWPDDYGVPFEDSWGEMARFVEEGKARFIGVSNYTVEMLDRCETVRHVDSLQPPLSLINRASAGTVIPWAAAHGTGVIVYSPMQNGILTDSFGPARVAAMDEDDWRRRSDPFKEPGLSKNIALRDALVPVARRHSTTVSAVAIAWALSVPGVSGAIVGARSPGQVDGWIDAGSVSLTDADRAEIKAALEATGAGSGPID
jgi:aryl-alcohol dehydrogenase-like predicted oxidoreductase